MKPALCVAALTLLAGCSGVLPMRDVRQVTAPELASLRDHYGLNVDRAMIERAPILEGAANWVPYSELVRICTQEWGPVQALLYVVPPMACTVFHVGADRDALNYVTGLWITPISYYSDITPGLALAHEAEHRKGLTHD